MSRTAREVVELYNLRVWNERDLDLADELLGDAVVRHGVDDVVVQSRAEARRRIEDHLDASSEMHFTLPVVVADADDEHVAIVYQCHIELHDGTTRNLAGLEVFRVTGGQIVEVWNDGPLEGRWA